MKKKASARSTKTSRKVAGFEPTKVALLVAVVGVVSIVLFVLMSATR